MYPLRNRNTSPDYKPYGFAPDEVPCMLLESSPGVVLVFTEDLIHGSFGGRATRRQLNLNFMGNPRTDEQLYYLKERYSGGRKCVLRLLILTAIDRESVGWSHGSWNSALSLLICRLLT